MSKINAFVRINQSYVELFEFIGITMTVPKKRVRSCIAIAADIHTIQLIFNLLWLAKEADYPVSYADAIWRGGLYARPYWVPVNRNRSDSVILFPSSLFELPASLFELRQDKTTGQDDRTRRPNRLGFPKFITIIILQRSAAHCHCTSLALVFITNS